MTYEFDVPGVPQQKGSTRAFVVKGRAVTTSANPKLRQWEHTVGWCARRVAAGLLLPPVALDVEFRMPRPASRPEPFHVEHVTMPDLDKLVRGVCDPISGVLYGDDAHIARLRAFKRYVNAGESVGARIRLWGGRGGQGGSARGCLSLFGDDDGGRQ